MGSCLSGNKRERKEEDNHYRGRPPPYNPNFLPSTTKSLSTTRSLSTTKSLSTTEPLFTTKARKEEDRKQERALPPPYTPDYDFLLFTTHVLPGTSLSTTKFLSTTKSLSKANSNPGPFFGRFKCQSCDHEWKSLQAWENEKQMCDKCKTPNIFFYSRPLTAEDKLVSAKHRKDLCEKCIRLGRHCCSSRKNRRGGKTRKTKQQTINNSVSFGVFDAKSCNVRQPTLTYYNSRWQKSSRSAISRRMHKI